MPPSRAKFMLGQLGRKPGATRHLARCLTELDLQDLDGPYRRLDQRTWRTGSTGATEWGARAGQIGSITAWRSFRNDGKDRWIWIQVTPLASIEDGPIAVDAALETMLANTRAKVRLLSTDPVPAPEITGASAIKAYDQHTSGGTARLLIYAVGTDFVALAASASGQPWTWAEVATVATRQQAKLSSGAPTGTPDQTGPD